MIGIMMQTNQMKKTGMPQNDNSQGSTNGSSGEEIHRRFNKPKKEDTPQYMMLANIR